MSTFLAVVAAVALFIAIAIALGADFSWEMVR